MAKRIALFFDGTWNTPDDDGDINGNAETNVCRLYRSVAGRDGAGVEQAAWYDEGVGTRWYNKLRGGVFGVGLSDNIKQGYAKLIDLYEPGDQIFIFGFSRGAYTARSLVGLVRNAGLLRREHKGRIGEAYSLYRTRDEGADAAPARFFRSRYAREVTIHFLAVWDTVGALGIPLQSFNWFNRRYYEFHDTELSGIVKNAYHAVAIDEHREDYAATMWQPKTKPGQTMEQVWFPGAHGDVGGGYPERDLADVTLAWIMEKAALCDLSLKAGPPALLDTHFVAPVHDSYSLFLKGVYSRIRPRYFRKVGFCEFGNECLHQGIKVRRERLPDYRLKNEMGPHLVTL